MGEPPKQGEVPVPLGRVLRTTQQRSKPHHPLTSPSTNSGVGLSSGIFNKCRTSICTTSTRCRHPYCAYAPCTSSSSDGTRRKQLRPLRSRLVRVNDATFSCDCPHLDPSTHRLQLPGRFDLIPQRTRLYVSFQLLAQ